MLHKALTTLALAAVVLASPSTAGSLQVSTVTLDVAAPGAATSLAVRNTNNIPVNAQIRVLRWAQTDGIEQMIPTNDVVASPPFTAIEPGREYTVRIVRIARLPVQGEESYRLLIDEIPTANVRAGLGINFAVRHSIPVFFGSSELPQILLNWRAEWRQGQLRLTATNAANKRVRLSSLRLTGSADINIVRRDGLVGYVLGQSTMSWTFPFSSRIPQAGTYILTAESDKGPINARIPLSILP